MNFSGNNSFTNNYADNSGGAVKWDDVEPFNVEDGFFKNNSAYLYGNNIASFASRIILIDVNIY